MSKYSRDITIELPEKVSYIIDKLYENGFEAFAVGGCVRDSILGRCPKDWDITTNALPHQMKEIFPRTVDTGIEHGTVTVMLNHEGFEVTTYRIDGEYTDSRHPKEVEFTSNLKLDLERRDFTINAMAYNDKVRLVDEFDGIGDLNASIIRCVNDAYTRFDEDALRILRAIRFSAQLGFELEEETKNSIGKLAHKLTNISAERIKVELDKTIMSSNPKRLLLTKSCDVMKYITELLDDEELLLTATTRIKRLHLLQSEGGENNESCEGCGNSNPLALTKKEELSICWAMLLYELSLTEAKKILAKLKFDNATADIVKKVIEAKGDLALLVCDDVAIRSFARKHGVKNMSYLLCARFLVYPDRDEDNRDISRRYWKLRELGQGMEISELAISGRDLIESGIKPGKQMGELINRLLDDIIQTPEHNNKEYLLEKASNQ